jgi:hypothetical protein
VLCPPKHHQEFNSKLAELKVSNKIAEAELMIPGNKGERFLYLNASNRMNSYLPAEASFGWVS